MDTPVVTRRRAQQTLGIQQEKYMNSKTRKSAVGPLSDCAKPCLLVEASSQPKLMANAGHSSDACPACWDSA